MTRTESGGEALRPAYMSVFADHERGVLDFARARFTRATPQGTQGPVACQGGLHGDRSARDDLVSLGQEAQPFASGKSMPAVAVDFPLRGEWVAANTPAERVPSHGTDQLAQRYAYDFIRIDRARRGWKFYRGPVLRSVVLGTPLEECYGWSAPIYAPFPGVVVVAEDGEPERNPVHLARDLTLVLKHAFTFNPTRGAAALRAVLGNHVILKREDSDVHAFLAHASCGSICVVPGQRVQSGQELARVGHSGNSTAPHLHFHLMDGPDIVHAKGLPCCFRQFEVLRDKAWVRVVDGLPAKREFIRCEV